MNASKLISTDEILKNLAALNSKTQYEFHLMHSIDSTNQFLKQLPISQNHVIPCCIAEMQTHGRGRFGRQWFSPFGENIYFSCRINFSNHLHQLSGLSLIVSLAILSMLNQVIATDNIRIKWPNDILYYNKKLCGTLIELMHTKEVIIGIGINVNSTLPDSPDHTKPWCSLHEVTGCFFDRNTMIAHLLFQLDTYIKQLIEYGLNSFTDEWNNVDYLKQQYISIIKQNQTLEGHANGIDELGQLILIDSKGKRHHLNSGDASIVSFYDKQR